MKPLLAVTAEPPARFHALTRQRYVTPGCRQVGCVAAVRTALALAVARCSAHVSMLGTRTAPYSAGPASAHGSTSSETPSLESAQWYPATPDSVSANTDHAHARWSGGAGSGYGGTSAPPAASGPSASSSGLSAIGCSSDPTSRTGGGHAAATGGVASTRIGSRPSVSVRGPPPPSPHELTALPA